MKGNQLQIIQPNKLSFLNQNLDQMKHKSHTFNVISRILIIIFILLSIACFSQNPFVIKWEKTFGGGDMDVLYSIQSSSEGGYLLGGYTKSNDGDVKSKTHGNSDFWVVKIDSVGNFQWEKTYGGINDEYIYSIQPTSKGGWLIGGLTMSKDGDVQSGIKGGQDFWVVKIDSLGTIQWEKTYGGSGDESIRYIQPIEDGGFLVGGSTNSTGVDVQSGNKGGQDFWIVKMDSVGTIQWEKTYGGSNDDSFSSIQTIEDGGFLIGGGTYSNDNDIQSGNHGSWDFWILKINNKGNIQWEKTYGGSGNEFCTSIKPTHNGCFLLGGYTTSNNGDIQSKQYTQEDFWVVKIDSLGNIQWEKTYGGNESETIRSIESLSDGEYVLLGGSSSKDGDVKSKNNGMIDFWIVKIDSIGTIQWENTFGGYNVDYFFTSQYNQKGSFLLGGYTESNNGNIQSGNKGGQDFWVVNLIPNRSPKDVLLSNSNITENKSIGSEIGKMTSIDDDIDDIFTYSLVSGIGSDDNGMFQIQGDKLLSKEIFDFETKKSYLVRLQTADSEGNIFSKSFVINVINLNDLYLSNVKITNPLCNTENSGSIEFIVNEFIPPLSFLWTTGDTIQNLNNISTGSYSIKITDGDNMITVQDFNVFLKPIFKGSRICYITSERESNVIHIDKGVDNYNVEKYIIYREGTSQNVFEKIGENFSIENYFIDSLINNRTQSFSYKVSIIDSCGNESDLSPNHNTIHLSQNRGTSGEVNLYWTHYIGLNIPSYSIYRQKGKEGFELLKQVSSNNNTYTDFTSNPSSNYQYFMSFQLEDTCYTEVNIKSGEIIMVKSNIVSTDSSYTGIECFYNNNIKIYPNPVNNTITIDIDNFSPLELNLYDIIGRLILKQNLFNRINKVDLNKIINGIYFLNLKNDKGTIYIQKIIKD